MKLQTRLLAVLLILAATGSVRALIFKPRDVHQWDTWVFHHDGNWVLYYLIASKWEEWDGFGVATSKDGVHWEERGTPVMKREDSIWLGTGSTWLSPKFEKDGRFIVNFSEQPRGEAQHIYFTESRDQLTWNRLSVEFRQDARWYEEKGRWDCICAIPRPGGGFYGYWTATPKGRVGFGFGESDDGVNWRALEAPVLDWGSNVVPKACEIGGVEMIGGKYYAIVGHPGGMMCTFIADRPQGPFRAAPKNFNVLVGNCYFARFVPSPDGLLVTHHSITAARRGKKAVVYTAPMKRALVDAEGTLRLGWWRGNEALKGGVQSVSWQQQARKESAAPVFLDTRINVRCGTLLEGTVNFEQIQAMPGFVVESDGGTLTAIRLHSTTATDAGTIDPDGTKFTVRQQLNRDVALKPTIRFRLLIRHSLVELYLDDMLLNVLSLPRAATGRIGFLNNRIGISDLHAWTLTLSNEPAPATQP